MANGNPYDVIPQLTPEQAAAWQAQFGSPPAQVNDLVSMANGGQGGPSPADIADLQGAAAQYGALGNTPATIQPGPDMPPPPMGSPTGGPQMAGGLNPNGHPVISAAIPDPEMQGIRQDVLQQTGQPTAAPNQMGAAAAQYGQAVGGNQGALQNPLPSPADPNARPAISSTSMALASPEGLALQKQLRAERGLDQPEPTEPAPVPAQYTPIRVTPGQRTPAAWTVREGNPVDPELQDQLMQARAGQEGAIAAQGEADVGAAQRMADLQATHIKASQDLNTIQQARMDRLMTDHQQQINKLNDIVTQARSRKFDESPYLIPGGFGKFFSAIGVALGAGVQARLGLRENPALQAVNGRVNEIMQKQKTLMDQDNQSINAQKSLLGQMQEQFGDQRTADQAARIALQERAQQEAEQTAQTSQVPRIRANATALVSALQEKNAQDRIAFSQSAKDQVIRKDMMTKPIVTGGQLVPGTGPQASGPGMSDAEREKTVQLPVEMGGYPGGTRLIANDAKSAEKLRTAAAGYSILAGLRDKSQALLDQYGKEVYIPGTNANNAYKALVTNAISQAGHVNAVAKQPIVDTEQLQEQLTPSVWNATGAGPTVVNRFDNALAAYSTSAGAIIKAEAPEVARRYVAQTPSGRVIPQAEYTGNAPAPQKMPGTKTGVVVYGAPSTSRISEQKSDVRQIPEPAPARGRGGKASVPYAPPPAAESDEDE